MDCDNSCGRAISARELLSRWASWLEGEETHAQAFRDADPNTAAAAIREVLEENPCGVCRTITAGLPAPGYTHDEGCAVARAEKAEAEVAQLSDDYQDLGRIHHEGMTRVEGLLEQCRSEVARLQLCPECGRRGDHCAEYQTQAYEIERLTKLWNEEMEHAAKWQAEVARLEREVEGWKQCIAEEVGENLKLFEILGVMPQIEEGRASSGMVREAVERLIRERDSARAQALADRGFQSDNAKLRASLRELAEAGDNVMEMLVGDHPARVRWEATKRRAGL